MSAVYFLRCIDDRGPIKVGYSIAPQERLQACMAWSPLPLKILALLDVTRHQDARGRGSRHIELRFHERYLGWRLHHEWHEPSGIILADIAAINAGVFDLTCLPEPGDGIRPPRGNVGAEIAARRIAARQAAWDAAHPQANAA